MILIGFMGSGKSTVSRLIAKELDQSVIDLDRYVEATVGRTVADIFVNDGEAEFRRLEIEALAEVLEIGKAVVSLGGGTVESFEAQRLLAGREVIYLKADLATSLARVGGDHRRPILARTDLAEIYSRRLPIYESLATFTVKTDGRRPSDVAGEILRWRASPLSD